jgi:hypothetical protein
MRDPKRIDEVTQLLNEIWHKYPDLRFWQLLGIIPMYKVTDVKDLYYAEDNETIEALKKALDEGF